MTLSRRTVLPLIKLKGFASPTALASVLGANRFEMDMLLSALKEDGLVKFMDAGVKLLPQGAKAARAVWRQEAEAANAPVLASLTEAFEPFDSQLKLLISDWKMRKTAEGPWPNDHLDETYDGAILDETEDVHMGALPLLKALEGEVPRCAIYAPRLESALGKLKAGNLRYMSEPSIESYETIWFELQEDLRNLTSAASQ